MPSRNEQYGQTLIGPPAYEEWLSCQLEDLLLASGVDWADRTELVTSLGEESLIRLDDYMNYFHLGYDKELGEAARQTFYDEGHTPILGISVEAAASQPTSYFLYRPQDVKPGTFGDLLLRGAPEATPDNSGVILARSGTEATGMELIKDGSRQPTVQAIQNALLVKYTKCEQGN